MFNKKEKQYNEVFRMENIMWLNQQKPKSESEIFFNSICILQNQFGYHIDQLEDGLFHAFCSCYYLVQDESKVQQTSICNDSESVVLLDGRRDNIKKKIERERERQRKNRILVDERRLLFSLSFARSHSPPSQLERKTDGQYRRIPSAPKHAHTA